jgi:hypothetical protein
VNAFIGGHPEHAGILSDQVQQVVIKFSTVPSSYPHEVWEVVRVSSDGLKVSFVCMIMPEPDYVSNCARPSLVRVATTSQSMGEAKGDFAATVDMSRASPVKIILDAKVRLRRRKCGRLWRTHLTVRKYNLTMLLWSMQSMMMILMAFDEATLHLIERIASPIVEEGATLLPMRSHFRLGMAMENKTLQNS